MQSEDLQKLIAINKDKVELLRLNMKWKHWKEIKNAIVDKLNVEGNEMQYEINRITYRLHYQYVYEQFSRKRYQRIKKKFYIFFTGDFIEDRKKALEMLEHFRNLYAIEAKRSGTKFYHRLSLEDKLTKEKFTIAGGDIYENLYGLAWEAVKLSNPTLRKVFINYIVHNKKYYIKGKESTFPDHNRDNPSPQYSYYPTIFDSQLDITFNYTRKVSHSDYYSFLSQVNEFELKQSLK